MSPVRLNQSRRDWKFFDSTLPRVRSVPSEKRMVTLGRLIGFIEEAVEDTVESSFMSSESCIEDGVQAAQEYSLHGFGFENFPFRKMPINHFRKPLDLTPEEHSIISALSYDVQARVQSVHNPALYDTIVPRKPDLPDLSSSCQYTSGLTREDGVVLVVLGRKGYLQLGTGAIIPFEAEDDFKDGMHVTCVVLERRGERIGVQLVATQPAVEDQLGDEVVAEEMTHMPMRATEDGDMLKGEAKSVPTSVFGLILHRLTTTPAERRALLRTLPNYNLADEVSYAPKPPIVQHTYGFLHALHPRTPTPTQLPASLLPRPRRTKLSQKYSKPRQQQPETFSSVDDLLQEFSFVPQSQKPTTRLQRGTRNKPQTAP